MKRRTDLQRDKATYEELYLAQQLSVRRIATQIGASTALVRKDLRKLDIDRRAPGRQKWVALQMRTAETYHDLYEVQGLSLREVAAALNVSVDVVLKDMQRFGLERRTPLLLDSAELARRSALGVDAAPALSVVRRSQSRRDRGTAGGVRYPDLDEEFFTSIDAAVKAYALGLIWTDGSIDSRLGKLRIRLQQDDAAALETIRTAMHAAPLTWHPPQPNSKARTPTVELMVCSKYLVDRLRELGLCDNKSERLPRVVGPPAQFALDFVRGAIDGDGSLHRPEYPTICFYNQNPHLRAIVAACWQSLTGKQPPTYAPIGDGKPRARLCEIGERARLIAHALYLQRNDAIAFERKRARAAEFQSWRRAVA